MPATRALPIPASHREFTIKVDGAEVPRGNHLLAATVTKAANKISWARLAYLDGSAAASDFPLSNDTKFIPGATIEVLAGAVDNPSTLFKGIVVRQSLKIRDHAAPQLVVECRHDAAKLSVGRKNAYFINQTDSDILSSLISAAGLTADVESTTVTHPQQVQYRASDWDFIVSRARANGKVVLTNGDGVAVKAPSVSGAAAVTLQFGATVIELDAEIDARRQFSAVKGISWDPSQQALVSADATDPGITSPGNLSASDLANVVSLSSYDLRHGAIAEDEAKAWADAEWLQSQINRVSGRAKCEGVATIQPGDVASLQGVGDRYSGNVYVTGVRHDFDQVDGWKTHVQFGGVEEPLSDDEVSSPPASRLLPAVHGLQVGIVSSNEDDEGEFRVRVRLPVVDNDDDGIWARVASIDAGSSRGVFIRPEVGDEVVVGFFDDDPRRAVILGMLHSSANAAPLQGSNANNEKVYQSRSQMKLYFNDDTKVMTLSTPGGNSITLSENDQAIKVNDQNGNKIEMTSDGITIESAKALTLKASTELKLESGTSFGAKGGTDLKLEGTASAELSCSATTTVKGGMVQIN